MTISADYAPNIDLGNGVSKIFAVNFPFGAQADLLVSLFDTVANANVSPAPILNGAGTYDYVVSGTPNPDTGIYPSGSITFNTALPATYKAVRERVTPKRQNTTLTNNGPFPAKAVEGTFDREEMQIQEAANSTSRALTVPPAVSPLASTQIPQAFFAGGLLLAWNSVTGMLTVQDPMVTTAQAAAASAQSAAALINSAVGMYGTPVGAIVNAPTGAEADGARYIVGTSPTGLFAGKANYIAQKNAGVWVFAAPFNGLAMTVSGLGFGYTYIGTSWIYGLKIGGSTTGRYTDVVPHCERIQDNSINPSFCDIVSQFGSTGGPTSHWHKSRGTPAAPTMALANDLLCSFGFRAMRESGIFGGSPAAMFVQLLEDSNGTDYPGVTWQWRGTAAGGGTPGIWMALYNGFLGLNDNTPATPLSIQLFQNNATKGVIRNTSAGNNCNAQWIVDNGTHQGQLIQFGTGYTTSSVSQQDGTMLVGSGAGGVSIGTGAAQPVYFFINNAAAWNINTSSHLMPSANNVRDIGSAGVAVRNIYSVNALNVTSDAATKENVRGFSDAEIAAANAVKWVIFNRIGGDRLHAGVVAQQVEEAFAAAGLDAYAYGVIGHDLLTEEKITRDKKTVAQQKMQQKSHKIEKIALRDGVAVLTLVDELRDEPVVESLPLFGADGRVVLDAHGAPRLYASPVTEEVEIDTCDVTIVPVMEADGVTRKVRRFVRYTELAAFVLAAHEARIDALEKAIPA